MATLNTFDEVEQILRQLSPERLRSVLDFINFLYMQEHQGVIKAEATEVKTDEWLALAEGSFDFWNNDKDAAYDEL